MIKKVLAILATIACVAGMEVLAAYEKVNTYTDGQFTDVKDKSWYSAEVKSAYEIGLMKGVSDNLFSPDSSVSVAECITMASRIHAIHYGKEIPDVNGSAWYDKYVEYADSNKIFESRSVFDNYQRPILRKEMSQLFAASLPESEYNKLNDVVSIPDVNENAVYHDAVKLLYRAGILCGNDSYGFFTPETGLKRSEAAAIVNRIAIPENRKLFELIPVREAFYLTDDRSMTQSVRNVKRLSSSWNYENRYDAAVNVDNTTTPTLSDGSSSGYSSINRAIEPQNSGMFTFETETELYGGINGARIYFENTDGENVFEIYTKDGFFYVKAKDDKKTDLAVNSKTYYFRVNINLDDRKGIFSVDGERIAEFSLSEDYGNIGKLVFSTTPEDILILNPKNTTTHMNYSVNETFAAGNLPYDFVTDTGKVAELNEPRDVYSLYFEKSGFARKNFSRLTGKVVFESYVYLPGENDKAYVSLKNSEADAVKVTLGNGTVSFGDVSKTIKHNLWQIVHIEADTNSDKAEIYINGKSAGTVNVTADFFDAIELRYDCTGDAGRCYFDDLKVYNTYNYPDYCPVPQKAESPDHTLIMSVCSIWREGTHYGWDFISPYDENSPLLGYYDEGIPEVCDWEIKQMTEHGIDAIQYCWFAGIPDTFNWTAEAYSIPMKHPQYAWVLHDGYFYAKYSDMADFCILWENGAFKADWLGGKTMSFESFKSYLWDYWVEYYFKDPRYLKIDNKIVFEIYSRENFLTLFGGDDKEQQKIKAKEIIDFMHEDIKNYGFDGIIITFSDNGYNESTVDSMLGMGVDGIINYGYGKQSYDPEYLYDAYSLAFENTKVDNEKYNSIAFVPTISIGYNILAWEDVRTPLATIEQHKKTVTYAKEFLAENKNKTEQWAKEVILFSTWNEFGEGHWLAPSGLNGYGYADVWREVFTNAPKDHKDTLPTENQRDRLSHMYNDTRTPIRTFGLEPEKEIDRPAEVIYKISANDFTVPGWHYGKIDGKEIVDGYFSGVSNGGDCFMFSPMEKDYNIDASKVKMIHIRMRSNDAAESGQIYYVNDDEQFDRTSFNPWLSDFSFFFTVPDGSDGEFADIYIDTTQPKYTKFWTGNIHRIRFDPVDIAAHSFDIDYIEFLGYTDEQNNNCVTVDGVKLAVPISHVEKTASECYIVAIPENGVFSANNMYHEYNRHSGKLYVKSSNGTEFVFTVGSDKVLVNNVEKKLERVISLYDNVPVLPFRFILDNAGHQYESDETGFHIFIRTKKDENKEDSPADENVTEDSFEFNNAGDKEGWSVSNAAAFVSDGALTVFPSQVNNNNGYDPFIIKDKLSIPADKYIGIEVKMHCTAGVNKKGEKKLTTCLYFTTDADDKFDVQKLFYGYENEAQINADNSLTFKFNVAENESWKGVIKKLRFDIPENNGVYSIDSIRFVPNPDYVEQEETPEVKPSEKTAEKPLLGTEPYEKVQSGPNEDSYEFNDKKLSGFGVIYADHSFDDENIILSATSAPSAATGYDAGLIRTNLKVDSSKYSMMVVRMKPEFLENAGGTKLKTVSKIYFTTDADGNRDEHKTLKCDIKNAYEDGDGYYVFVFVTSENALWTGTITSILFDPTDNNGTFTIDYIRFSDGTAPKEPETNSGNSATSADIGTKPVDKVESSPNEDSYEFNDKKLSGFGIVGADFEFDDTCIILKATEVSYNATGYDVGLLKSNLNIPSDKYSKIVVRIKSEYRENKSGSLKTISKIYFTTDTDASRNEVKTLKCDVSAAYDDGDGYYVFVFDVKENSMWKGNITSIMFDPTDNNGVYSIDYLRFV